MFRVTSGPSTQDRALSEYIALCRFLHIEVISRQKEARSRDYALPLFRMTSIVIYIAQYHRQHCTLNAFGQFRALYMHNHDDKYTSRPGFEPGTSRLHAAVDTSEPSWPAVGPKQSPKFTKNILANAHAD